VRPQIPTQEKRKQILEKLKDVLDKLSSASEKFLIRDFNARVGKEDSLVDRTGKKVKNTEERLREVCDYRNLKINNAFFTTGCTKYTWIKQTEIQNPLLCYYKTVDYCAN
jgi:hypothetical protein